MSNASDYFNRSVQSNNKSIYQNEIYKKSLATEEDPQKEIYPNPYEENTPKWRERNDNIGKFKDERNYLELRGKYDKENVSYYNKEEEDFVVEPYDLLDTDKKGLVKGNRSKLMKYAIQNNLYSKEDWERHEIKDDTINWLWNKDKDIDNVRGSILQQMGSYKSLGIRDQFYKNAIKEKKKKDNDLGVFISKNAYNQNQAELEGNLDPIEPTINKVAPGEQDVPEPPSIDMLATPKKLDYEPMPFDDMIDKDSVNSFDISKSESTAQAVLPPDPFESYKLRENNKLNRIKLAVESDKYDLMDPFGVEEDIKTATGQEDWSTKASRLVSNSITVSTNEDYSISWNIKEDLDFESIQKGIEDLAEQEISKLHSSLDNPNELITNINNSHYSTRRDSPWGPKRIKSDRDKVIRNQIENVEAELEYKLNNLDALKALKLANVKNIPLPSGVDVEDMAFAGVKGASPTILNQAAKQLNKGLGGDRLDFDIGSFLNRVITGPSKGQSVEANIATGFLSLFTDGLETGNPFMDIFKKTFSDTENWEAAKSLMMDKYNVSDFPDQQMIADDFEQIEKWENSDGAKVRFYSQMTASLAGEILGPFKIMGKGVNGIRTIAGAEQIGAKLAKTALMKSPQFLRRQKMFRTLLGAQSKAGGRALPNASKLVGGAFDNVVNTTLASFGSQLLWHGQDPDLAVESAQGMFGLEVLNQAFGYAATGLYRRLAPLNKILKKTGDFGKFAIQHNKRLSIAHYMASYPAQAVSVLATNPDADSRDIAGELAINFLMSGGTFRQNREFAKQLKSQQTLRKIRNDKANRYASEVPSSKIEVVYDKTPQEVIEENSQAVIQDISEGVNEDGLVKTKILFNTDKNLGFYDAAKDKQADKRKSLFVNDLKEDILANEEIPSPIREFLRENFENIGGLKIRKGDEAKDNPGYYLQDNQTIYLNNGKRPGTVTDLHSTIIHEAVHGITVKGYKTDPVYEKEVNETANDMFGSDAFAKRMEELNELGQKGNEKERQAHATLKYITEQPSTVKRDYELLAAIFDPQLQPAIKELIEISKTPDEKGQPKNWYQRLFASVKDFLSRTNGKEVSPNQMDALIDFVTKYDYNKVESLSAKEIKDKKAKELPFTQKSLFAPDLTDKTLQEYNEHRTRIGLRKQSRKDINNEYVQKYGYEPKGAVLEDYIKDNLQDSRENLEAYTIANALGEISPLTKEIKDPNDIRFAEDIFSVKNMAAVIRRSKDMSRKELENHIFDEAKNIYVKGKAMDIALEKNIRKIAALKSDQIKQIRMETPLALSLDGEVTPIHTPTFGDTKPISRQMGKSSYFQKFLNITKKNSKDATGKNLPYVTESIGKFFNLLDADNIKPIPFMFKEVTNKKGTHIEKSPLRSGTFQGADGFELGKKILSQGYFVMPRGGSRETLLEIPFLGKKLKDKEGSLQFAKDLKKYSFFRWLDSDSNWNGEYKGNRQLTNHADKLNFDLLVRKFVGNDSQIKIKDIVLEGQKVEPQIIQDIGKTLKQYYKNANNEIVMPSIFRDTDTDHVGQVLDALTDFYNWGVDAGGGARNISFKDNMLDFNKTPLKYHSIVSTSEGVIKDAKAFEAMLPDNVVGDVKATKEYGAEKNKDGDYETTTIFADPRLFLGNDLLDNVFNSGDAFDGGTISVNERFYNLMAELSFKRGADAGGIKGKAHITDDNGNMTIFKTAIFGPEMDNHTREQHPEIVDFLDKLGKSISLFSMASSSKGSNTFKYREYDLKSTDNPNAIALFDNRGHLQRVVEQTENGYKDNAELLELELGYIRDNFQKGIVDDRMKVKIPLTGDNGFAMIGATKDVTKREAGSFQLDNVVMTNKNFPFWQSDGGAGYEAIQELQDKGMERNRAKSQAIFDMRALLVGGSKIYANNQHLESRLQTLKSQYKAKKLTDEQYNSEVAKITEGIKGRNKTLFKEHQFDNQERLESAGAVIKDMIEDFNRGTDETAENNYLAPGLNTNEIVKSLNELLDTEGRLSLKAINRMHVLGDLFTGKKYGTSGNGSKLNYMLKRYLQDALKTNTFGQNLVISPDVASKAAVHRHFDNEINKLDAEGDALKITYLKHQRDELIKEHITDDGRLKPYANDGTNVGKGIIVSQSSLDALNLKVGDKAMIKLTPVDDLHSIAPVVIIGVTNKPGMITHNKEYLTKVLGRDFDIDKLGLIASHDKYISKDKFNDLWNLYDKNQMNSGKFKQNANDISDRGKELTADGYKMLNDDRVESQEPMLTPQSDNSWSYAQSTHVNPSLLISLRNTMTNAFVNGVDKIMAQGEDSGIYFKLELPTETKAAESFMDDINTIIQKSVDSYDGQPFDTEKAFLTVILGRDLKNSKGDILKFNSLKNGIKNSLLKDVKERLLEFGNPELKKFLKEDKVFEASQLKMTESLTEQKAVPNKVMDMMRDVDFDNTPLPEIGSFEFMSELTREIGLSSTEIVKRMAKDKNIPASVKRVLFDNTKGSDLSIPQHLKRLFIGYTKHVINRDNKRTQEFDMFPYISNNRQNFVPFAKESGWENIAVGTILNDYFNSHEHVSQELIKNRVYLDSKKEPIEYFTDNFNGFLKNKDGKRIPLKQLFDSNGELVAKWVDGKTLRSQWLRDLVMREENISSTAKALTVGRTLGNVSKFMSERVPQLNANEMVTVLGFMNGQDNISKRPAYQGRNAQPYEKTSAGKKALRGLHAWKYGKETEVTQATGYNIIQMEKNSSQLNPFEIVQGAKETGLDPIVGGTDYLTFANQYADKKTAETLGDYTEVVTDKNFLGRPNIMATKRMNGLDISKPQNFIESLDHLLKNSGSKDYRRVRDLNLDNYADAFNKVIQPAIHKLIAKEGITREWTPEQVTSISMDYIRNFGPRGMDAVAKEIQKRATHSKQPDEANYQMAVQMAMLSSSLKNHFKGKEGDNSSFYRATGDRTLVPMLNDYTAPENKRNYGKDEIILEAVTVSDGKANKKTLEDGTQEFDSFKHRIGDLVNERLNISVGHATLPDAYVKKILPLKMIERVGQGHETNVESLLETKEYEGDIEGKNNFQIEEAVSTFDDLPFLPGNRREDTWQANLHDLLGTIEVRSAYDGDVKTRTTQLVFDGEAYSIKDLASSLSEGVKKQGLSETVLRDLADAEALNRFRKDDSLDPSESSFKNESEMIYEQMKNQKGNIEELLRMKLIAFESADVLTSQAETTALFAVNNIGHRTSKQEILREANELRELAERLRSGDFKEISKLFRSVNYADTEVAKTLMEDFYEPTNKVIDDWNNLYHQVSGRYHTKEFGQLFDNTAKWLMKNSTIETIERDAELLEQGIPYSSADSDILNKIYKTLDKNTKWTDKRKQSEALRLYNDAKSLNARKYNMNERMYLMGHEMGLEGFETSLSEATVESVFRKGHDIRLDLMKQFEDNMKRVNDYYEVNLVDRNLDDWDFDINGTRLELSDALIYMKPELATNKNVFTYSLNNFKSNIKSKQVSTLSSLENALKIDYIKNDNVKRGTVEEKLVMGALGEISGNKFLYNEHKTSKEFFESQAKTEAGTEMALRYMNGVNEQRTVYGRFLGKETISRTVFKNGKNETVTEQYVFVEGLRENGGKLHAIKQSSVNDVVLGEVLQGKTSIAYQMDRLVKRKYDNSAKGIVDQMAKELQKSSSDKQAVLTSSEMDKSTSDRQATISQMENIFQNSIVDVHKSIDKNLVTNWKDMSENMNSFIVGDSYLGGRHFISALAGVSGAVLGLGALATSPAWGGAMMSAGAILAVSSGAKYGGRLARMGLSNILGTASWTIRNNSDKSLLIGGIKSIVSSWEAAINKETETSNSNAISQKAQKDVLQLKAGNTDTRLTDMFVGIEKAAYGNDEYQNVTLLNAWKKRKLSKGNIEIIKKVNEEMNNIRSVATNANELIDSFKEKKMREYADKEITFVGDTIYLNGKALSDYQKMELGMVNFFNYFLSWKGKAMELETISHINSNKVIRETLSNDYQKLMGIKGQEYMQSENAFMTNAIGNLVQKSIGNYQKSPSQRTFLGSISERYSRFALKSNMDQTSYLKDRWNLHKAVHGAMMDDVGFKKFYKDYFSGYGDIQANKYKVNNPTKELRNTLTLSLVKTLVTKGLKLAGGYAAYQQIEGLEEGQDLFAMNLWTEQAMTLVGSAIALILDEEKSDKSQKDLVWQMSGPANGFIGYGPSVLMQSSSELIMLSLFDEYQEKKGTKGRRTKLNAKKESSRTGDVLGRVATRSIPGAGNAGTQFMDMLEESKKEVEKAEKEEIKDRRNR